MNISSLTLTGLNITEDDYDYRGIFILKNSSKSLEVDMSELSSDDKLIKIKEYFNLSESLSEIREKLMTMIIDKAHISSKISEGEKYEEKSKRFDKRKTDSFDII